MYEVNFLKITLYVRQCPKRNRSISLILVARAQVPHSKISVVQSHQEG